MQKITDMKAREYYIKATIELGWSRNVLDHQIKSMAYERHMAIEKQNNFQEVLPAHLAEQADLAMKDSYMLDFLGIKKPIIEAHLAQHMVLKIKHVIMELGFGFVLSAILSAVFGFKNIFVTHEILLPGRKDSQFP